MELRSCFMLVNNTSLRNCRQYTIKIFTCGDFEFLSKTYGLSGASGIWRPGGQTYLSDACELCAQYWIHVYVLVKLGCQK